MPVQKGPRPDTAEKYWKAVRLVNDGYSIEQASSEVGISHTTYGNCKKHYEKNIPDLKPSGDAPLKVTVVRKRKRKASPYLPHLPVTETPALTDREVTVAIMKVPLSALSGWFK